MCPRHRACDLDLEHMTSRWDMVSMVDPNMEQCSKLIRILCEQHSERTKHFAVSQDASCILSLTEERYISFFKLQHSVQQQQICPCRSEQV